MTKAPTLTLRQEFVLAQLYVEHGWSVPHLERTLGVGRRMIENALRRQNVELRRGKSPRIHGALPDVAALEWFAEAARPERVMTDPAPQTRDVTAVSGEITTVFRDRRCQHCGTTNHYVSTCDTCGAELAYRRPDRVAAEVDDLFEEAGHRG